MIIPNIEAVIWFYENCWKIIIKKLPHTKFVIAGRNPSLKIKKLNNEKNITVTGEVSSIIDVLKESKVSIAPMISGSGMQFKVLESMSESIPVVATEIGLGDLKSVIGRDILVSNDPLEFSDYVIRLLLDDKFCQKIGENGKKYLLKNHSYEVLNEKFAR